MCIRDSLWDVPTLTYRLFVPPIIHNLTRGTYFPPWHSQVVMTGLKLATPRWENQLTNHTAIRLAASCMVSVSLAVPISAYTGFALIKWLRFLKVIVSCPFLVYTNTVSLQNPPIFKHIMSDRFLTLTAASPAARVPTRERIISTAPRKMCQFPSSSCLYFQQNGEMHACIDGQAY